MKSITLRQNVCVSVDVRRIKAERIKRGHIRCHDFNYCKIVDAQRAKAYSHFEMGFYGFIFSVNSHCLVITHQFNFLHIHTHSHGHKDKGKSSPSGSQCKWLKEQIKWKPASERAKREKKRRRKVFPFLSIIRSLCHRIMKLFVSLSKWRHSSYRAQSGALQMLKKTRWVDRKLTIQIKKYTKHKACAHNTAHNDANHPFDICLASSERMRACVWVSMEMAARIKTASFVLKLMTKVSFICWDFFLARQPFSSLEIMCARDVSISRRFVCFE